MYCLVYMYIFISECERSVVHTWICLAKKNSSISGVYIFDGLYYRARRGSASKQQGEKSSLITILFSSTCHIILQTVPVCNPYAQINLLSGKGTGAPNDNFRKNICLEDDFRSRIFGSFVVKFLACLPLLGFSNI